MANLPVLVLNSGSSSIKFSVYEAGEGKRKKLLEGAVDGIGANAEKNLGKFSIKSYLDGEEGKKLVDEAPSVPDLDTAFALVAKPSSSLRFHFQQRSGTAWSAAARQSPKTSASLQS